MAFLCPSGLHVLSREGATCPHCAQEASRGPTAKAATMALLGLTLASGCGDKSNDDTAAVALYGVEVTDADDDGWYEDEGDCNDSDPNIHPEAEETPGDGIDSNCDGNDDT